MVDAVVAGHSHQVVHHWVAGVPVIEGGAMARYFNLIYLTVDRRSGKLIKDRTRIEGPIPVCAAVFRNQGDCDGDRPAPENGRGALVTPIFHGKKISQDPETLALLKSAFERAETAKKRVVGKAARVIEHERFKESSLGNLVADAIRAAGKADVALVNSGGIRAPLPEGEITYGDVFRTLPFENYVSSLQLTGKQLKLLLRVAQSGSRGFPPLSGMRLKLIDLAYDAPASDLNSDRRIEPWEVNRLLQVEVQRDGKWETVKDDRTYRLATIDFLVRGGDDWAWVIGQVSKERIHLDHGIVMRDALISHINELGELNPSAKPLVDPAQPRLVFEKPSGKKQKGKGRSRGKRSRR
jgi:5'-nucleotidase